MIRHFEFVCDLSFVILNIVPARSSIAPAKKSGVVAQMREIFDQLFAKQGGDLTRKTALAECAKAGFNKATSATQWQKWKVGE